MKNQSNGGWQSKQAQMHDVNMSQIKKRWDMKVLSGSVGLGDWLGVFWGVGRGVEGM